MRSMWGLVKPIPIYVCYWCLVLRTLGEHNVEKPGLFSGVLSHVKKPGVMPATHLIGSRPASWFTIWLF